MQSCEEHEVKKMFDKRTIVSEQNVQFQTENKFGKWTWKLKHNQNHASQIKKSTQKKTNQGLSSETEMSGYCSTPILCYSPSVKIRSCTISIRIGTNLTLNSS